MVSVQIVLFVLLFFVLFFGIIPFVLAYVGGWAKLAAEYRLRGEFQGQRWRFQDVMLRGWCGYNGCVSIGASAEGLYLNTIFVVLHPPLLIPWTDLSVKTRDKKFLGIRLGMIEFVTDRVPDVSIGIKQTVLEKIAAARGRTDWNTHEATPVAVEVGQ